MTLRCPTCDGQIDSATLRMEWGSGGGYHCPLGNELGYRSIVTSTAPLLSSGGDPCIGGTMTQPLGSLDPLLSSVVLISLAIGLPIVIVLSIRFLWYRDVSIGRSKELEKLIWQLHRIATAMEHEKGLSFPVVQPGTEDSRVRVTAQQQPSIATPSAATPSAATPSIAPPSTPASATDESHRAGVNSMFGL
jgi:hypothetical protein